MAAQRRVIVLALAPASAARKAATVAARTRTAHRWATSVREGAPIPAYAEADAQRLADLLPTLREKHATLIADTAGFGNQAAARRTIEVRVVAKRIRRGTTLSRHVLAELDKLELPRVETTMSEAVAYGEIGFSGTVLKDGAAAEEITALTAELQAAGALP